MTGLPTNVSGDSLTYLIGMRWRPGQSSSWVPYVQLLGGGNTLTKEWMFPERKRVLEEVAQKKGLDAPAHAEYTTQADATGVALSASAGLDYQANRAVAIRLATVEYMHTWASVPGSSNGNRGFQISAGMVVRLGTW